MHDQLLMGRHLGPEISKADIPELNNLQQLP